MYGEIFLALIVSLDTYFAALTYSNSGIKIPPLSTIIISIIGAVILGIALKFSELLSMLIPLNICRTVGLIILTAIGVTSIFKSLIRGLVKKISDAGALSLKMESLGFCVCIYLDDTAADFDKSKSLSAVEAAALALASSLDSAATGINFGFSGINPWIASLLTFGAGIFAIYLGAVTGKKFSGLNHDFSWLGGVFLIIFAMLGFLL